VAVLLFKLRNAPDQEADEIRALLKANSIDFYETSSGAWGISMPAIWLHDEQLLSQATELIDGYQRDRQCAARDEYERLRRQGRQRTIMDLVKESPVRAALFFAASLLILYISVMPFLDLI
jgi:hypothetical protein